MSVELKTLGRIRVIRDDEEAADLMRQKRKLALLVYLAVERETSRERVAGMFWRDREPDRARHSLSQALYALRGTLGDGWLTIQGDRMAMTPSARVDATEFEALAASGDADRALERYRGPFLNGFACGIHEFDHWADRKRATLDRLHRRLRKEAVDHAVREDRLKVALGHARAWAAMDSMDDEAQHRFIELLAAAGERSNALRQYEIYGKALTADGLTPLEDTEDLINRIRAGEPIVPVVRAATGAEPERLASSRGEAPAAEALESQATERRTLIWGAAEVTGPRLVRVVEGGREAEAYALGDHVGIGRNQGDIRFPHDTVMSSLHASIRMVMRGDGRVFLLQDEQSRNGVFVRMHGDRPLRDGDVFAAGKQVFQFNRSTDPETPNRPDQTGPGAATRLGIPADFG